MSPQQAAATLDVVLKSARTLTAKVNVSGSPTWQLGSPGSARCAAADACVGQSKPHRGFVDPSPN